MNCRIRPIARDCCYCRLAWRPVSARRVSSNLSRGLGVVDRIVMCWLVVSSSPLCRVAGRGIIRVAVGAISVAVGQGLRRGAGLCLRLRGIINHNNLLGEAISVKVFPVRPRSSPLATGLRLRHDLALSDSGHGGVAVVDDGRQNCRLMRYCSGGG